MAPPKEEAEAFSLTGERHRDTANPTLVAQKVVRAGPRERPRGSQLPAGASGLGPCAAPPPSGGLSHRPRGPAGYLPQGTPRTRRPPPGDPSLPAAFSRTSRPSRPKALGLVGKLEPSLFLAAAEAVAAAAEAGSTIETQETSSGSNARNAGILEVHPALPAGLAIPRVRKVNYFVPLPSYLDSLN